MRAYWIDVPYVSSGLRRSYMKKLEVYSGEVAEDGYSVKPDKIYRFLRGKWVDKGEFLGACVYSNYNHQNRTKLAIKVHNVMPTIAVMKSGCVYSSLEMAQAAKMILIQEMERQYEVELDRIRELVKKNIPDINKPLAVLKEDYPEYFI